MNVPVETQRPVPIIEQKIVPIPEYVERVIEVPRINENVIESVREIPKLRSV